MACESTMESLSHDQGIIVSFDDIVESIEGDTQLMHRNLLKLKINRDMFPLLSVLVPLARKTPPTTYGVRFESFKTMMELVKDGYYESRPFTVGGYDWTFLIYPTGNKKETSLRCVSLYARLLNSCHIPEPQAVYAEIKFFAYNPYTGYYFYFQESEPVMFHSFKPEWGVANFQDTRLFEIPGYGFSSPGGQCEFGIDVFIAPPLTNWEVFSYDQNITDPIYNWNLTLSTCHTDPYTSDTFISGGRNWVLKVYPNGYGTGTGNYLSLYLLMSDSNGKDYCRATLRILSQCSCHNVEKTVEGWSTAAENGWGCEKFISLSDLNDKTKGFLVNSLLKVEVKILAFSKTTI